MKRLILICGLALGAGMGAQAASPVPQSLSPLAGLRADLGLKPGDEPSPAWLIKDGNLVALFKAPKIYFYSVGAVGLEARWVKALTKNEVENLESVCDLSLESFNLYRVKTVPKIEAHMRMGMASLKKAPFKNLSFSRVKLSDAMGKPLVVRKNIPLPALDLARGEKYAAELLKISGVAEVLLTEVIYEKTQTQMARWGRMAWVNAQGQVLAQKLLSRERFENFCADCEPPVFGDGIERIYRVDGLWRHASLSLPLILSDSSTVEGRSRSFSMLKAKGQPDELRVYEYVANCGE